MKRISTNAEEKINNEGISPKKKCNLTPKVPQSHESCTIELPDGTQAELPVYAGTEGPKVIDGR